jgi:hypothetical protein
MKRRTGRVNLPKFYSHPSERKFHFLKGSSGLLEWLKWPSKISKHEALSSSPSSTKKNNIKIKGECRDSVRNR